MSENNSSDKVKLFGVDYETTVSTREIPVSKKAKEEAKAAGKPEPAPKSHMSIVPVFENHKEFVTFVANAAAAAEAGKAGNGLVWLNKIFSGRFEDATEVAYRGDKDEWNEKDWQDAFISIETGGRSVSALAKAMEEASAELIAMFVAWQNGSWEKEQDDSGAKRYEDAAHFTTVMNGRNATYTKAKAMHDAAVEQRDAKAAAKKAKDAAKKKDGEAKEVPAAA